MFICLFLVHGKSMEALQVTGFMAFLGMSIYKSFYKTLSAYYVPGTELVARREQGCGDESNKIP